MWILLYFLVLFVLCVNPAMVGEEPKHACDIIDSGEVWLVDGHLCLSKELAADSNWRAIFFD